MGKYRCPGNYSTGDGDTNSVYAVFRRWLRGLVGLRDTWVGETDLFPYHCLQLLLCASYLILKLTYCASACI